MRGVSSARRRDYGLPGNGGKFATRQRSAPDTALRPINQDELDGALRSIMRRHPEVLLSGRAHPGGRGITLDVISVRTPARGAGHGSAAMAALHRFADERGSDIYLTPDPVFGGDPRRLYRFYTRLGYVPHRGTNPDETMVRLSRG